MYIYTKYCYEVVEFGPFQLLRVNGPQQIRANPTTGPPTEPPPSLSPQPDLTGGSSRAFHAPVCDSGELPWTLLPRSAAARGAPAPTCSGACSPSPSSPSCASPWSSSSASWPSPATAFRSPAAPPPSRRSAGSSLAVSSAVSRYFLFTVSLCGVD